MQNKVAHVLTILSIILFVLGIFGFLAGLIVELGVNKEVATYIYIAATLCELSGFGLMFFRFAKYGMPKVSENYDTYEYTKRESVKTVDVKPIKETPEERLYKQYEDLYNHKLITKQDLDKKRKELLGK